MNTSTSILLIPLGICILAILVAIWLARWVTTQDTGTPEMRKVSDAIYKGAQAFLSRQYRTIAILAIVAAVIMGVVLAALAGGTDAFTIGWHTSVAFLVGAALSGTSGYIGMRVAVQSNIRVASAARRGLGDALMVALRGGAVSGIFVMSLSLLGVIILFFGFGGLNNPIAAPQNIVGFGFGASFVALFAQLGGGIYTKAADVGADLVGKVEAGIPEDDPRNPAVIADLVGDNVGDCAGRGADIFESTSAENIGAMILGAAVASTIAAKFAVSSTNWVVFPLVAVGLGILCSLAGLFTVRKSAVRMPAPNSGKDAGDVAMGQLNVGFYVTAILAMVAITGACYFLLSPSTAQWWRFAIDGIIGVVTSLLFVWITQYYTAGSFRPVREIAEAAKTGPATTIIAGIAVGYENVAFPVLTMSAALGAAYWLGTQAAPTPATSYIFGVYGTAVATMGMLMSAAYILAMDTFGPITDNAGGIVEMSGQDESVRNVTDALDSVGNTTKALTKGYGIGSAALAAFLLFSAYLDVIKSNIVNLANPVVFIAALIGAALIFVFSSFAIRAVGSTAQAMIQEVRRQFREKPGIMTYTEEPDYARCVDISASAALRQMVVPGILAVAVPILVGITLGPEAAAGVVMAGTIVGILMALFMNNAGGAWDNAKKFIEANKLKGDKGETLGKGTPAHAAAVVGDTVGDPFKDTAGPSLHVLIKLLSTITLVMAPLFIALHR